MRILALVVLVAGILVIQAGFTESDVPFDPRPVWRDYAFVVLVAAAVAVLLLRPLRLLASFALVLAAFAVWFGFV